MKRLTPAMVTLMMVVVVSLLVTAYFAKMLIADESLRSPVSRNSPPIQCRDLPIITNLPEPTTKVAANPPGRVPSAVRSPREQKTIETASRPNPPSKPAGRPQLKVSPGMRAVSVSCPRGTAVPGELAQAGQYVDVYMTPKQSDPHFRGGVTLTLLKGVRVLANRDEGSGNESTQSVLLEITPEQANILILAREKGNLALSYNPEGKGDGGIVLKNPNRATMDDIFGFNTVAAVPTLPEMPAARSVFLSEVYKGSERSLYRFADGTRHDAAPGKTSLPAGKYR